MTWLKYALITVLSTYVLVLIVLFFMQRQFFYHPDPVAYTPQAAGLASFRAVTPDDANPGLASWFRPPDDDTAPLIVYAHGNAGSLAYYAYELQMMADWGYGVMAIGYPGYGGAPGAPSERSLAAAAQASYDWLIAEGVAPNRIILYGHSLGSGVAARLAVDNDAAGLILSAPFTSMAAMAGKQAPWLPGAPRLVRDRFDTLSRIDAINMPLVWTHGQQDRLIPETMGARVFDKAHAPKCAFPLDNAAHNNVWARGGAAVVKAQARSMTTGDACEISD